MFGGVGDLADLRLEAVLTLLAHALSGLNLTDVAVFVASLFYALGVDTTGHVRAKTLSELLRSIKTEVKRAIDRLGAYGC